MSSIRLTGEREPAPLRSKDRWVTTLALSLFLPREADPDFYKMQNKNKSANTRSDFDEGMLLLAQVFLFAEADGYLGTMSSNIGRLVYELAYIKTHGFPLDIYDMAGNLYYHCSCTGGHQPFGDAWDSAGVHVPVLAQKFDVAVCACTAVAYTLRRPCTTYWSCTVTVA